MQASPAWAGSRARIVGEGPVVEVVINQAHGGRDPDRVCTPHSLPPAIRGRAAPCPPRKPALAIKSSSTGPTASIRPARLACRRTPRTRITSSPMAPGDLAGPALVQHEEARRPSPRQAHGLRLAAVQRLRQSSQKGSVGYGRYHEPWGRGDEAASRASGRRKLFGDGRGHQRPARSPPEQIEAANCRQVAHRRGVADDGHAVPSFRRVARSSQGRRHRSGRRRGGSPAGAGTPAGACRRGGRPDQRELVASNRSTAISPRTHHPSSWWRARYRPYEHSIWASLATVIHRHYPSRRQAEARAMAQPRSLSPSPSALPRGSPSPPQSPPPSARRACTRSRR